MKWVFFVTGLVIIAALMQSKPALGKALAFVLVFGLFVNAMGVTNAVSG